MRFASSALILIGLVGLTTPSHAGLIGWTASLDGSQEAPPNSSTASGTATGSIDTVSGWLEWNITWTGLAAPALAMHFHKAAVGVNGPVQVFIIGIPAVTSGSVSGSQVIASGLVTDLLAGLWYLNIHTALNPGGEIRGQIMPITRSVPEPNSLPLLGAGLLGLVFMARRRRRTQSSTPDTSH